MLLIAVSYRWWGRNMWAKLGTTVINSLSSNNADLKTLCSVIFVVGCTHCNLVTPFTVFSGSVVFQSFGSAANWDFQHVLVMPALDTSKSLFAYRSRFGRRSSFMRTAWPAQFNWALIRRCNKYHTHHEPLFFYSA